MEVNRIYLRDALEGMRDLADESVQCCVTSPPYYQLRDYGVAGQIGQEEKPSEYIKRLVEVFSVLKTKMKKDGTLWCNLGDTYAKINEVVDDGVIGNSLAFDGGRNGGFHRYKAKDLMGIPWSVAFALRDDGWYLRQDIIWNKPNPLPESVMDRCTKGHEYIFLLSLSPTYFFDQQALKTPLKASSRLRLMQEVQLQNGGHVPGKMNGNMKAVAGRYPRPGIDVKGGNQGRGNVPLGSRGLGLIGHSGNFNAEGQLMGNGLANRRSVWTIGSEPNDIEHYAVFPEALASDCIRAGSRNGDLVLDPFVGSGTTAVVAACLERKFIGFEINPTYAALADQRIRKRLGLFYDGHQG